MESLKNALIPQDKNNTFPSPERVRIVELRTPLEKC